MGAPGENAGGKKTASSSCCGAQSHLPGDSTTTPGSGGLKSEWDPRNKPEGAQAGGFGQLCKAAIGRSGLLGWERIAAGSSLPLPVPALHIRDWGEELPRALHGPKLQIMPRTVFPVWNKGLEPARNPLRNRICWEISPFGRFGQSLGEGREKSDSARAAGSCAKGFQGTLKAVGEQQET